MTTKFAQSWNISLFDKQQLHSGSKGNTDWRPGSFWTNFTSQAEKYDFNNDYKWIRVWHWHCCLEKKITVRMPTSLGELNVKLLCGVSDTGIAESRLHKLMIKPLSRWFHHHLLKKWWRQAVLEVVRAVATWRWVVLRWHDHAWQAIDRFLWLFTPLWFTLGLKSAKCFKSWRELSKKFSNSLKAFCCCCFVLFWTKF